MKRALTGSDIFDGERLYRDHALILDGEYVDGIVAHSDIPAGYPIEELLGGTILPGFVDLQVNGGGGVMFNDETHVEGLRIIAEAHATTGTRAMLPTLITDTPERTRAAVDAVEKALEQKVPGLVGLHLEGPHLSITRKGAHSAELIRPMGKDDEAFLLEAARRIQNLMITVAPESVTPTQIERLSDAGIIVSLGHTDCSFDEAKVCFAAGARCVTHLFNAMSQMGNREPGLVGAALDTSNVFAGLIADNVHVHQSSMQVAIAAMRDPGQIFLVTDAMSTVGSDIDSFTLNGREVLRRDGRLTLDDGTLAGADLELPRAISILVAQMGLPKERALAMATAIPAQILPNPQSVGFLRHGAPAKAIWLDDNLAYHSI